MRNISIISFCLFLCASYQLEASDIEDIIGRYKIFHMHMDFIETTCGSDFYTIEWIADIKDNNEIFIYETYIDKCRSFQTIGCRGVWNLKDNLLSASNFECNKNDSLKITGDEKGMVYSLEAMKQIKVIIKNVNQKYIEIKSRSGASRWEKL